MNAVKTSVIHFRLRASAVNPVVFELCPSHTPHTKTNSQYHWQRIVRYQIFFAVIGSCSEIPNN